MPQRSNNFMWVVDMVRQSPYIVFLQYVVKYVHVDTATLQSRFAVLQLAGCVRNTVRNLTSTNSQLRLIMKRLTGSVIIPSSEGWLSQFPGMSLIIISALRWSFIYRSFRRANPKSQNMNGLSQPVHNVHCFDPKRLRCLVSIVHWRTHAWSSVQP